MMDPGALGTLIIGLDSVRLDNEQAASAARSKGRTRRKHPSFGAALAGGLRSLANRLDRPVPHNVPG
jgi:hypothetical protein